MDSAPSAPTAQTEEATAPAGDDGPLSLMQILEILEHQAQIGGKLTVEEIVNAFKTRVYGPLLFAPALIGVLPVIGALPGVSMGVAALITFIALQLALGLPRPWLPRFLMRVSLPGEATVKALRSCHPAARRMERWFKPRLVFLTRPPWRYVTGVAALCLGLMACVGALVPGLIVPPLLVIMVLALGMAADDGLVLLIAFALMGVAAGAMWWLYQNVALILNWFGALFDWRIFS